MSDEATATLPAEGANSTPAAPAEAPEAGERVRGRFGRAERRQRLAAVTARAESYARGDGGEPPSTEPAPATDPDPTPDVPSPEPSTEPAAEPAAPAGRTFTYRGQAVNLTPADQESLLTYALDSLVELRKEAGRSVSERSAPASPAAKAAGTPEADDPVLARIERLERSLQDSESRSQAREARSERDALLREIQSEIGTHSAYKTLSAPNQQRAQGLAAFFISHNGLEPKAAVKASMDMLSEIAREAKSELVRSKVIAARNAVPTTRPGGNIPAEPPRKFGRADLKNGNLLRAAVARAREMMGRNPRAMTRD